MASGDIPSNSGGPLGSIQQGIGIVDDFSSLFRGKSSSDSVTTEEDVSPEKAQALIEQILGSVGGLAAVSQGQKNAGLYNSTVNQQLTNDLLTRSASSVAALSSKKTTTQEQHKKGALEWIICTELNKQGRLPHKFYRYGARVFASYSDYSKQGYYIWAVPAVKHLRKHPNSMLSNIMEIVFNARAEYLAAIAGCKSAKKSVLGFLTTHILFVVCVALSRTIARKPIDFMSAVYPTAEGN